MSLYYIHSQLFGRFRDGGTTCQRPAHAKSYSNRRPVPLAEQGIQPSCCDDAMAARCWNGDARHPPAQWARPLNLLVVAILSSVMLLTGPVAVAKTGLTLFGSQEIRSRSLHKFTKWTGMLARNTIKQGAKPDVCTQGVIKNCVPGRWLEIVEQLRNLDRSTQIDTVNSFINGEDYALDSKNWGVDDYWATPSQFLAKDGDCEDFAIAKYLTLKWLGMDASNMRIVVLQDRRRRIVHAVLAVYEENNIVILDNLTNRPLSASAIHHYKPLFSINEEAWWLHMSRRSMDN